MLNRIKLLPHWCVSNKYPAFYDTESATAIEQTAKLYGKTQELIEDYNKFVDEINNTITDFINGVNSDQECFKNKIIKIIHDYIAMIDEKILQQDEKIDEAVLYMKENISNSITETIAQMKEMGELDQSVLDAIDGIGTRVVALEEKTENHGTSINDLNTRLINLENAKVKLIYNAETESLNFENVEVVKYE